MKWKALHQIIVMSKYALIGTFMQAMLATMLMAEGSLAQKSIEEIYLDLNLNKDKVETVFKKLERKTGFVFAYKENVLQVDEAISQSFRNESLGNILRFVAGETGLKFRRVNNHISVLRVPELAENIVLVAEEVPQQVRISGKVTSDEDGEPLPGVSIIVKGTSTGTTTDLDGNFSLSAPEGSTLVFSFIGFLAQEVEVGNQSTINIVLQPDLQQLEEVVVIGFGEKARKDLTGSIATVDAKTIEKTAFLSPQFALQGNTPGVRVLNTSGDPNAEAQIQIRGIGTWQGRAQPLYVIDGQVINEVSDFGNQDVIAGGGRQTRLNLWNLINPQDIESITVLKDASAAAVYGSRAANGVILITTRKGKTETPTVEFSTQVGWSTVPREERLLGTKEWVDLVREARNNSTDPNQSIDFLYGLNFQPADPNDPAQVQAAISQRLTNASPQFNPNSPFYINENTAPTYDHQDYLLRTALDQNYNVKVSGASEKTDYYLSFAYKSQEHPHVGNEIDRYTAAININSKVKDWLKVGINYKFAFSENRTQEEPIPDIISHSPWQPVYSDDPNISTNGFANAIDPPDTLWAPHRIYGQGTNSNYLAQMQYNKTAFELMRNLGQGYFELTPLQGLKIRGSVNFDLTDQTRLSRSQYFTSIFSPAGQDPALAAPDAPNSLGSLNRRRNIFYNYQSDLTVSYERTFGKHNASILVGGQDTFRKQSFQNMGSANIQRWNPVDIERTGYPNDLLNNSSILGFGDAFWFGYVARGSYNYDSKYYLDLSFRRDASSGFDEDYRWGNFYSVAGAWRISAESFMDNVTFLDDLKIRGGYGEAGNDELAVGNFAFLSTVAFAGSTRFGSGNGDATGSYNIAAILNDFPNFELSWETGVTAYVGFDALMLESRLSLTGELYQRTTQGILQSVQLAPSLGTGNPILNLGEVQNRGIDLDIGWNDRIGSFQYGIGLNGSFVSNEVTDLFRNQPFFTGDAFGGDARRIEVGRSIGHIWGYVVEGIYQTQAEIDARNEGLDDQTVNLPFVGPGDLYYRNVGSPSDEAPFYSTELDTVINNFDQTEIGNTLPSFIYGINLNASWKGFDFQASFYGEAGAEKINGYRRQFEATNGGGGTNFINTVRDRWTPSNTNTMMPRAVSGDPAGNNRLSTRWVESASFFRLNNWQVGYTVPPTVLNKLNNNVRSLRVFVGGQNNILITNWSGLDPINDRYPLPRTLLVGLNASF